MSFTSTYAHKKPNYKGIGLTVGFHALLFAGAMALPAITAEIPFEGTILAVPIEVDKDPSPPVKAIDEPIVDTNPPPKSVTAVTPIVAPPVFNDPPTNSFADVDSGIDFSGLGDRVVIPVTPVEVIPDPVIADAKLNSRYSNQFQPPYPSGLLRMGEEGLITVRVLVGTDGRAKQIELVESPHEEFWTATKRHALKKWRFEPATTDGAAFESWITLKVRFEINS
ncbi:energy transducer TonB [Parasphingorhabdus litoris]|uniref:Energy transducer TonB n=1 Tax=Parasphingorhabdus litoris TaxID=394733 RepID=A0ABN1AFW9_9SPHN|nr:energy transducer TonB [Parasphingorhabdus litoris]